MATRSAIKQTTMVLFLSYPFLFNCLLCTFGPTLRCSLSVDILESDTQTLYLSNFAERVLIFTSFHRRT